MSKQPTSGDDRAGDTTILPGQAAVAVAEKERPAVNEHLARTESLFDGRYVLEDRLGGGGMGIVYRARDTLLERHQARDPYIALKLISESLRNDQQVRSLLQRECSRAQRLSHPNIVRVFHFGCAAATDTDYLTMELLRGRSLDQLIRENPSGVPWDNASPLILELLAGLHYAHNEGIVHSDIKPSNLFVTDAGRLKILDFGIAAPLRSADGSSGETLLNPRRMGAVAPRHSSLEMFQGKDADASDDVYSAACVIYELVSGKHPYRNLTTPKACELNLVPETVAALSETQNQALRDGLKFRRSDRPKTIMELQLGLFPTTTRASHRNTTAYALAGAAATAVVALVVYRSSHQAQVPLPTTPVSDRVSSVGTAPPQSATATSSAPALSTAGPSAGPTDAQTAPSTAEVRQLPPSVFPPADAPLRPTSKTKSGPENGGLGKPNSTKGSANQSRKIGTRCESIQERMLLGETPNQDDRKYLKENCP